jgi:hypothetical protein
MKETAIKRILIVVLVLTFNLFADTPSTNPTLRIHVSRSSYTNGGAVSLEFVFSNETKETFLVTRGPAFHDLSFIELQGPRGFKLTSPSKLVSRSYPADFFVQLPAGKSKSFTSHLPQEIAGALKPGKYRLRIIYGLTPPEYFKTVSKGASVPQELTSNWVAFEIKPPGKALEKD